VITLYAVTWRADAPRLDEDGLVLLADGELAIVAGPAQGTTTRDDALAHGRIVEQVASAADVLPIRYGTTAADADEALALLHEHGSAWAARLQKVEGCAEVAIRAAPPAANRERAESGSEHLARLVSRSRLLNAAEGELGELLTGRCRVVRRLAGHEELKLSCLVERSTVDAVRSVLEEWAATRDDLDVSVTGPWAPYSFVADGQESGVAL
jgi:Gas vesicle synthesis protein GvpL/GvpF